MRALSALTGCVILLVALLIDRLAGEPPLRIHPVVWMGKYLSAFGAIAVRRQPMPAFLLGALGWTLGAGIVGGAAWVVQWLVFRESASCIAALGFSCSMRSVAWVLLAGWLLKAMLSWRMLADEIRAVEAALHISVEAGRERLSWLVSRDTAQLSEIEVRESAIESLAENLNDSVVAPIFWFALFGLPGAAIYRFANTADAMWGYRGLRAGVDWEWAGKWAARADDVLSWLPARITALLMALAGGGLNMKMLQAEARKTPSPNSGWPMAAMALLLNVCLRKTGAYTLNPSGRQPDARDTVLTEKLASKTLLAHVFIALAAIIVIAYI